MLKLAGPAMGLGDQDLFDKSKQGKEATVWWTPCNWTDSIQKEQQKKEQQANLKRNLGNKFLTNKDYAKAIEAYTEGIKINDQCHLLYRFVSHFLRS